MSKVRGADAERLEFDRWEEVEAFLKRSGHVIFSERGDLPGGEIPLRSVVEGPGGRHELFLAMETDSWRKRSGVDGDGLIPDPSGIFVTASVFAQMTAQIDNEESSVRRLSSLPITRTFVYLDISDFSRMPSGVQQLVILALVRLSDRGNHTVPAGIPEAQLCIGDGFIYIFKHPVFAVFFARWLADSIEKAVAKKSVPEFHFRIGAHVGPVRCFWDPGRKDWNYVGDGINGGNRVLAAIGKDTDDVVFISGELRSELVLEEGSLAAPLIRHLHNKGRKADKHGRHWRVYELNHSAR